MFSSKNPPWSILMNRRDHFVTTDIDLITIVLNFSSSYFKDYFPVTYKSTLA